MADTQKYETDVAIIGAGGAGICAGIEALDAGARVTAFELGAEPGGAAIRPSHSGPAPRDPMAL